jgi:hypothetical protein
MARIVVSVLTLSKGTVKELGSGVDALIRSCAENPYEVDPMNVKSYKCPERVA